MPAGKTVKQKLPRPQVRSLKIQPRFRNNSYDTKTIPEIKLAGNWLEKLGFVYGKRVTVTTMNELMIIKVEE